MIPLNQIVLGDCVKVLKGFPENSIDCVVTDPPHFLLSIYEGVAFQLAFIGLKL